MLRTRLSQRTKKILRRRRLMRGEPLESRTMLAADSLMSGPFAYLIGGEGSPYVASADLDGDQNLDLITSNWNDDISVLLGHGDGQFAPEVRYATGDGVMSIVVEDFNRDDIVDIATANSADNSVSVLLGKGDGTFQKQEVYPVGGRSPAGVIAGDLDRDGDLDLVTANQYSEDISVLLGDGQGGFGGATTFPTRRLCKRRSKMRAPGIWLERLLTITARPRDLSPFSRGPCIANRALFSGRFSATHPLCPGKEGSRTASSETPRQRMRE